MYLLTYLEHSGFGLWTDTPRIPTHESKDPVDGVDSLWKAPPDSQQNRATDELLLRKTHSSFSSHTWTISVYSIQVKWRNQICYRQSSRIRNSAIIYQFIYLGRVMSWIMNRQIIFTSKNLILALKLVEERRMCEKLGINLKSEKCRLVEREMCLSFPWKYSIHFWGGPPQSRPSLSYDSAMHNVQCHSWCCSISSYFQYC